MIYSRVVILEMNTNLKSKDQFTKEAPQPQKQKQYKKNVLDHQLPSISSNPHQQSDSSFTLIDSTRNVNLFYIFFGKASPLLLRLKIKAY